MLLAIAIYIHFTVSLRQICKLGFFATLNMHHFSNNKKFVNMKFIAISMVCIALCEQWILFEYFALSLYLYKFTRVFSDVEHIDHNLIRT